MNVARPDKLSHLQTIFYEIDMLRYAAGKLELQNDWERWSFLECFLLHFRNLIEFFGRQPTRDDLSILKPGKFWPSGDGISCEKLKALYKKDLWEKYEVRTQGEVKDKISRYLHHCTEQRVDSKNWNVGEMLEEIEPLISAFEGIVPVRTRHWGTPPHPIRRFGHVSQSTATVTIVRMTTQFPPDK